MRHVTSFTFATFLAVAAPVASLAAQSGPARPSARPVVPPPSGDAELRGRIVNAAGQPVPEAAVTLRAPQGTAIVAGTMAGADGRFRLLGLQPGTYALRVTRMGFTPRLRSVTIAARAARVDTDTITMTAIVVNLAQVDVRAEQAAVVMEADRNSYRAKDLAPAAANASEVLENIPSVQVDAEGRVSLRGNENVVVQINGRPTPLRGAQLAAFLKQLPGALVERVEVVPNPSAKYDPEGMGGVLNIVLRQEADLGMSGGITGFVMNGDRWNGSGNVGWQEGRLSLFGSVGANRDLRDFTGVNDRSRYDPGSVLLGITEQDLVGTTRNRGENVTGNLDFRLTPRDVLSQALVVNTRRSGEESQQAWTEYDGAGAEIARSLRPRDARSRGLMVDWTSAWKRTVAPRRNELAAEFRVNRTVDTDAILLTRRSADGLALLEGERNDIDARATQLTAQLDWTRALGGTRLETGLRANSRWLDRDFVAARDLDGSGTWVPSALSNAFEFDEHVQAGYGVLTRGIGRLELQGGLRGEYTARRFALASDRYPYDYFRLFPSASLSYALSPATTARASYSRRIRRPGTQELNPFPMFMDAQNAMIGNPNLRPEFTDAIEFGLSRTGKTGSVQFSPFYRRTSDIIRIDIDTDAIVDGRPVTAVSFVNLATSDSYGADLNTTWRPSERFSLMSNVNVFRLVTDGGSTSAVGSDAIAWGGRLNATLTPTKRLTLQATYNYRAPFDIEGGRFGAFQMATFVARHTVQNGRGAIVLRVLDPFATNRFEVRTGTDRLVQFTNRQPGVRGVFLGYQFNTGTTPRLRQPRPQDQPQGGSPFGGPA